MLKEIQTELTKNLKIAGIMRVADFPFFPAIATHFSKQLDHLVISFVPNSYYEISSYLIGDNKFYDGVRHYCINGYDWCDLMKYVDFISSGCVVDAYKSVTIGTDYEEPLRRLDSIKPDYVILLDTDDALQYGGPWEEDLDEFIRGDYDVMMMKAVCVGNDDRKWPDIYTFPVCPHMRAFKWNPSSTFIGSGGFCEVAAGEDSPGGNKRYIAKSRLIHLPFFTREMQREREWMYGRDKVLQQKEAYLNDAEQEGR